MTLALALVYLGFIIKSSVYKGRFSLSLMPFLIAWALDTTTLLLALKIME